MILIAFVLSCQIPAVCPSVLQHRRFSSIRQPAVRNHGGDAVVGSLSRSARICIAHQLLGIDA